MVCVVGLRIDERIAQGTEEQRLDIALLLALTESVGVGASLAEWLSGTVKWSDELLE